MQADGSYKPLITGNYNAQEKLILVYSKGDE